MPDLSFQARDQTHAPAVEVQSLNHWTTKKSPNLLFWYLHPIFCSALGNNQKQVASLKLFW